MVYTRSMTSESGSDMDARCFHENNYKNIDQGWWSKSGKWIEPHCEKSKINHIFSLYHMCYIPHNYNHNQEWIKKRSMVSRAKSDENGLASDQCCCLLCHHRRSPCRMGCKWNQCCKRQDKNITCPMPWQEEQGLGIAPVSIIQFRYELQRKEIKQGLSEACETCGEEW